MIRSMTGYGSAKGVSGQVEISIELKSVNSRYLDCTIKMPRMYIAVEERLKAVVQRHITRGKVDVFVTVDASSADEVAVKLNRPLVKAYLDAFRELSEEYGIGGEISAVELAKFPDVLRAEKSELDSEQIYTDMTRILEEALRGYDEMRESEGEKLSADITARLCEIERLIEQAEVISPRSVMEYRRKLEARMMEILKSTELDESRILTEAVIFADKVAVNEETVRLRSHISQLREILKRSEPVGRKIDFLVQEFNREANTIGSKGNDAEMAKVIVELKVEIEKIREQAQNIE